MNSNANDFLEEYGLTFKNNSVISTSFKKYFHPKETLITDGLVSKEILRTVNQESDTELSSLNHPSKASFDF